MNIDEYARTLLFSPHLEDKLLNPKVITSYNSFNIVERPLSPGRDKLIAFSDVQIKFPKPRSLHVPERRATALHFFANHELLAIEMMAAAILCLPTRNEMDLKAKKGLIATIADEQKHFLESQKKQELELLAFYAKKKAADDAALEAKLQEVRRQHLLQIRPYHPT